MNNNIYHSSYLVHFADTDAAGVVYFANVLKICHQAYENSLIKTGFELKTFFQNTSFAIPIIHAEVDFFAPLFCGDELLINLIPKLLTEKTFQIDYEILKDSSLCAKAQTKHIAINPTIRKAQSLPSEITSWVLAGNE